MTTFWLDNNQGSTWTDWHRLKSERQLSRAPMLDELLTPPPFLRPSWPCHGGPQMEQQPKREKRQEEQPHLPEWKRLFQELEEEAEERYPDGRFRVRRPKDDLEPQP